MDPAPGEQILFSGHPSWRSILGFYLKGMLGAVIAGVVVGVLTRVADHHVNGGLVAAAVAIVFGLVVVAGLVKRVATTYTITNQRLSIRRGILSRTRQETRLDRVQNVNTNQSFLQRLLQVGTVDFDTAGSEQYDFAFVGVAEPEDIAQTVDRAQRQALREESVGQG